jgi:spermidine synthase
MTPAASSRRLAALLFLSGMCAIAYQTAWLRLLRLVFGASTAASAAVLAVFMLGLGAGSLVLGRRADSSGNPLRLYARLEMAIAVLAALSPWLVASARWLYIELGGTPALGPFAGTALRLLLAALVLGPPTFLMGGTLPAITRAAEDEGDRGRRTLGLLYGANTLGAVSGALLVTFVAVEHLGTRKSILLAAAINLLIGLAARALARQADAPGRAERGGQEDAAEASPAATPVGFALVAAALVGFVFFLMELVWYRMLSPLLGGSSYTFGLILAIALAGIGAGGLLYAAGASERRPTAAGFALTCALEALALALPFALGDRIAFAALVLRGLGGGGFAALAFGWSVVAGMVVLPAALVAGYQFPLLVALLGSGRKAVGREVGLAYGWNTAGSIAGALAGGFGLMPLLTAPRIWRLAVLLLAAAGAIAAWVSRRRAEGPLPWRPLLLAAGAVLLLAAGGPSAAWRHSGIGAGRFRGDWSTPNQLRAAFQSVRSAVSWEAEGNESSVALWGDDDYAFFINGKSDGSARGDAATQVMSGLVGAMLHPRPRSALVIGLGTGSTAGWLAAVPGIERVDAAEIEPAIVEVARACAPVNRDCLRNPRLRLQFGDARELLQVSKERYDLIFSEPSNPYRAGISSLFTTEFYDAAAAPRQPGGLFLQWVQGYEVDAEVVRTAFATLSSVFPYVETWQIHHHDLLLVAGREPIAHDVARLRVRSAEEPFAAALDAVWGVGGLEGFYTGFLAPSALAVRLREAAAGDLSTDDRPRIEFGFIRNLGRPGLFDIEELRQLAGGAHPEPVGGEVDWARVEDLRQARATMLRTVPVAVADAPAAAVARLRARAAFAQNDPARALGLWLQQGEEPASRADLLLVAGGLAARGEDRAAAYLERLRRLQPTEALALEALWRANRGEPAAALSSLLEAWRAYRADPWPHPPVMLASLDLALRLADADAGAAPALFDGLAEPFAVHLLDRQRLLLRVVLADQAGDGARCRQALTPFEPAPLWERSLLEARQRCYTRWGPDGALARRAAGDLAEFLAAEPLPLEEGDR